jgi:ubiquitin-protein ligase
MIHHLLTSSRALARTPLSQTPWEGATYKLELHFKEDFPAVPPIVYL